MCTFVYFKINTGCVCLSYVMLSLVSYSPVNGLSLSITRLSVGRTLLTEVPTEHNNGEEKFL